MGFNYFIFKVELFLYIIAVAAAFVIGGVGAGLTTWGEATAFFRQVATEIAKRAKTKDEKEEKQGNK